MQGYNFTERVRKSLGLAREEAGRLGHEYVGTEHILLGLIAEAGGVATSVLGNLKVEPAGLRAKIEGVLKAGTTSPSDGRDLPYTSRAKKVLELAMTEARDLGHAYVGTEHLLLGLLREEKGIAAQVLNAIGVTIANARAETVTLLGSRVTDEVGRGSPGLESLAATPGPSAGQPKGRLLFTISSVLAWFIGGMLIINPATTVAPLGIALDEKAATIAQAQGAILFGLGFINWLARRLTDRGALAAILYGNLVVNALSFAIVLRALVRGFIPMAGVIALVLHATLGAAFAWQLMRIKRG